MDYSRFGTGAPAPPGVVVAQPKPRCRRSGAVFQTFRSTQAKVAGSIQIVMAVLAAIIASVALALHRKYRGETKVTFFASPAVWMLALYINAGAWAIVAAFRRTKCAIVACLVLSLLVAISAAIHLMIAAWVVKAGVREIRDQRYYYNFCATPDYYDWGGEHMDDVDYDYDSSGSGMEPDNDAMERETRDLHGRHSGSHDRDGGRSRSHGRDDFWDKSHSSSSEESDYFYGNSKLAKMFVTLSAIYVLTALMQFVAAVWAAVLCCRTVCCGRRATTVEASSADLRVVGVLGVPPTETKDPLTGPVVVVDPSKPLPTDAEPKSQDAVGDEKPYPMVTEDPRDMTSPPPAYHGSGFLRDEEKATDPGGMSPIAG